MNETFKAGDQVAHRTWGRGTVTPLYVVAFEDGTTKQVTAGTFESYAPPTDPLRNGDKVRALRDHYDYDGDPIWTGEVLTITHAAPDYNGDMDAENQRGWQRYVRESGRGTDWELITA